MTPQDEREALIAAVRDPEAYAGKQGWRDVAQWTADAILALRQPGAEYRRAYLMTGSWELDPAGKSPGIYIDDPKGGDPICLATLARIYHEDALRSALLPDTKGEGRG